MINSLLLQLLSRLQNVSNRCSLLFEEPSKHLKTILLKGAPANRRNPKINSDLLQVVGLLVAKYAIWTFVIWDYVVMGNDICQVRISIKWNGVTVKSFCQRHELLFFNYSAGHSGIESSVVLNPGNDIWQVLSERGGHSEVILSKTWTFVIKRQGGFTFRNRIFCCLVLKPGNDICQVLSERGGHSEVILSKTWTFVIQLRAQHSGIESSVVWGWIWEMIFVKF